MAEDDRRERLASMGEEEGGVERKLGIALPHPSAIAAITAMSQIEALPTPPVPHRPQALSTLSPSIPAHYSN